MRVGQVADAMRVRAGVAPRVASGDPAASKGKSAGGASFGKSWARSTPHPRQEPETLFDDIKVAKNPTSASYG
eukprot:COSAG01_NODE_6846_length_3471_cov_17.654804_5_plen_72_part_01